MKKALKIIYYLFIAFIIIVALLFIFSATSISGNFKTMIVISGSMEPAIKTGSIIVISSKDNYKAGDIINFQRSQERDSTTHRVVEVKLEGDELLYITQGDANNAPDIKEVKESEIKGKVFLSIPYLGYVVDFAKKPIGFALLVFIPAAVIISDEIKKIIIEIKKKNN